MKKLNADQKIEIALLPAKIILAPIALADATGRRIKKTAQHHPAATSIVVGSVAGLAIAMTMIDGEKVHQNSLYARLMNH